MCPYSLTRPGGVQGQVIGLCEALVSLGHDVSIIAPSDGERCELVPPVVAERLISVGRTLPVPANGSVAPLALSPLAPLRALRALAAGEHDVVHVHEPYAPGPGLATLLRRHTPMVWTFHRSGRGYGYFLYARAIRSIMPPGVRRCAVSNAAQLTAEWACGGTYEVLFNGVDLEGIAGAEPATNDRPVICFIGRHEHRKGLAVLLEAFAELSEIHGQGVGGASSSESSELWIVGEGPETAGLRRRWSALANVKWLGSLGRAELASRLAGAQILCAPSLFGESFGVVLLEAMAAHTLVVASDIAGYRDVVADHGVLFPPGDVKALVVALTGALSDVRDKSGNASAHRLDAAAAYAGRRSFRALAERYLRIYGEVSGSSRRG